MIYDAVVCVGPQHKDISLKAIRSLILFSQSRKIFVITSRQNFSFFKQKLETKLRVNFVDEDRVIDNINLGVIQNILNLRDSSHTRAGWYFQQFLKMSICNRTDVADYYLIWDADTLLLQPLQFFDENGMVLINPKKEHHKPYFEFTENVLSIEKQVDFSFISEHLMVKKSFMKNLIDRLMDKAPDQRSWVELIINSIDNKHLAKSGFSEYETYGNFVALNFRSSFKCRPLKSTRCGTKMYGMTPDKHNIISLMMADYVFVTFEHWHSPPTKIRRVKNKVITYLL